MKTFTKTILASTMLATSFAHAVNKEYHGDWTLTEESGTPLAYTSAAGKPGYHFGLVCTGDDPDFVIGVAKGDYEPLVIGEPVILKGQIDASPVYELSLIPYNKTWSSWDDTPNANVREVVRQVFAGKSFNVRFGQSAFKFAKFSLIGFTASYHAMADRCSDAANAGFVQPTTRSEYDRMVNEGFVEPNDSSFNY